MKILMIVNSDGALYVFRKPIIQQLISSGHEVVSITPQSKYFERIAALGVRPIALDFSRHSASPLKNVRLLMRLFSMIREERPDLVHSFTHKPAIYGTLAARLAGVPKIFVTITGLGNLFVRDDRITRLVRNFLLFQYKFALRFVAAVFFQNPDDMELFEQRNLVPQGRGILTAGSGLDVQEFELPDHNDIQKAKNHLAGELGADLSVRRVVLFPARGTPEKGFFEFYEAAKIINQVAPGAYLFLHLGLIDSQPSWHFTKEGLSEYSAECGVHYLGFKDDIQTYMRAADIVALPSKYREGTPRSLIEALGLGKVIVTTDMPGCRETVISGWNGYLCKPADIQDFVAKIMAVDDSMLDAAKSRSRKYCEVKYDAKILVAQTLSCYGIE